VIEEVEREFPDTDTNTLITISNGKGKVVDPFAPIANFVASTVGRLTTTQAPHEKLISRNDFEKFEAAYFRFEEEGALRQIDLAAADKVGEIKRLAKKLIALPEVQKNIGICASRTPATARLD
jgi:hypothetical protein